MDLAKIIINVSTQKFTKTENNLYKKHFRSHSFELDEAELLNLIEQYYVAQYALPVNECVELSIEKVVLD